MGDLSGESGLETRPPLFIVWSLPCSRAKRYGQSIANALHSSIGA